MRTFIEFQYVANFSNRYASTTLDSVIVAGDFGSAIIISVFKEIRTPEHAAHSMPLEITAGEAPHDKIRASQEPIPYRLRNGNLTFRGNSGSGHLHCHGRTNPLTVQPGTSISSPSDSEMNLD